MQVSLAPGNSNTCETNAPKAQPAPCRPCVWVCINAHFRPRVITQNPPRHFKMQEPHRDWKITLPAPLPCLAVDLDGTLTPCDTMWEAFGQVVCETPARIPQILMSLKKGPAGFKRALVSQSGKLFDPSNLPWSSEVLSTIDSAKKEGREVILATGADQMIADKVGLCLGLFDKVVGSDGKTNLVGEAKRAALQEICGDRGFEYIGNDTNDLPVWSGASKAVAVRGAKGDALDREMRKRSAKLHFLSHPRSRLTIWLRAARVEQWLKNLLVFAPMLAAHNFFDIEKWASGAMAMACFCLCASGAYLLNDMVDRWHDRSHPRKKYRPVASGELGLPAALLASAILPLAGLIGAWSLGVLTGVLTYYILTLLYSLWFRQLVIIDIIVLACLYCLRIFVGGEATDDPVSTWMASFAGFLFVSMAAAKRYAELHGWQKKRDPQSAETLETPVGGRGYREGDIDLVRTIGVSTACIAPLILNLYILDKGASVLYSRPEILMTGSVLIFVWLGTLWRDTIAGLLQDEDPLRYSLSSPRSLVVLALFGCAVLLSTNPN